jgi:hypothetical protein
MRRVKRWNDGTLILRWVLVGVLEAPRGFRRIKGHKDMHVLVERVEQQGGHAQPQPAAHADEASA